METEDTIGPVVNPQSLHARANLASDDEAKEFISSLDGWALLPLPCPMRPDWKRHSSARLRLRQKRRFQVWRVARGLVATINALDQGGVATKLTSPDATVDMGHVKATDARSLAVGHLLKEAASIARARRSLGLTGAQNAAAVASVLKQPVDEAGYMKFSGVRQVPMIAERVVEPSNFDSVDMLAALPDEDKLFYENECNVVESAGKSEAIFRETESRYGFIGGTEEEYLKYLGRPGVSHLWERDLQENIRAVAGVSVVLKKNGYDQRKLIMQVAANYMFSDPSERAQLGMHGGAALSRCFVETDHLGVALCDEDSAFTFVRVPQWMTHWQGGPPVIASKAWHMLPTVLQSQIKDPGKQFVSPRYLRLAMGGSHSVYILMRINLHHIGKTLMHYANSLATPSVGENDAEAEVETGEVDIDIGVSDLAWEKRQTTRKTETKTGASGFTVDSWCQAVRTSKAQANRTCVVMHFFAGERRPGDIEHHVRDVCDERNIPLLMISIDLATDANWDYTIPATFHSMMQLVDDGLVDIVVGGPPCSTVARSRHVYLKGGPRPLRFRWCLWGRGDLKPWEFARVKEANTLWLNYMTTCEGVSSRGGAHLWEHPADPEEEPFPSVWCTTEMLGLERRTDAVRALLHQCAFGGIAPKLTCFSGTLKGLSELDGIRCPGVSSDHKHGHSIGRDPTGGFYTRRLQAYPSGLCRALAELIGNTLQHFLVNHQGPTGALRKSGDRSIPRIPTWSTWSSQSRSGIVLLNEACVRRQRLLINARQSAAYVHVDDTVVISSSDSGSLHCDTVLSTIVTGLERVGFCVSQQERDDVAEKVVGYEVVRSPASFRLPVKKMVLLRDAMLYVASRRKVHGRVLRALVGVWIFGALLRRELLSIPHALFHFLEIAEDQELEWWASARSECVATARVIPLMSCHVGSPVLSWLFATDAMGENELNHGGYGMVATKLSDEEVSDLLRHGEAEGLTVARLSDIGGSKYPDKSLTPTVPFTLLPQSFFDPKRWRLVERGRWRYGDHITLGESRTVLKLLRKVASNPKCHDHAVFTLQDNRPTACSMTKGRSPSFALNRILRQRTAVCLAARLRHFLPWVESEKQPADESSRIC